MLIQWSRCWGGLPAYFTSEEEEPYLMSPIRIQLQLSILTVTVCLLLFGHEMCIKPMRTHITVRSHFESACLAYEKESV